MQSRDYVSPFLSEKKEQRLKEKLEKPPDLVAFMIAKNSQCAQCKKKLVRGSFLFMEADQPLCLICARLDDLVFLQKGNAKLTRNAKKKSTKFVIVMKFSSTRKRYERQGILVPEKVLADLGCTFEWA